jgi:peptide/nickel transport system permease protein
MLNFIFRRILEFIPSLFLLLTFTFFLIHLAPGDPTEILFNPQMSEEAKDNLRKAYGLDKPVEVQYVKWMVSFCQGEFGTSFHHKKPVKDVILAAVPNTLLLASLALFMEFFFGILIGIIAAVKQRSIFDYLTTLFALTIYSIPEFWLALVLVLVFALNLGWLPATGMIDVVYHDYMTPMGKFLDLARHLILPAICLGLGGVASIARYTRGNMLEVIRQDYIRTARAKGLAERVVIYKHALKNAMLPIVTIIGLSLPYLISGSFIIETVFGWPGMGRVGVEAAFTRDYPLLMAEVVIAGVLVMFGNLLADILYGVVDPRVRY